MCRWFAYISPDEDCLLSDVLIDPANAISKQCSEHYLPKLLPHGKERHLADSDDRMIRLRNSLLNMDGLGIAWYTPSAKDFGRVSSGQRPALYKSPSPPLNDFNFRSLCSNTATTCVFAHIRASSGSVTANVNSHPFVFGRHAFMHNGVVSDFHHIRRSLCNLLAFDAFCNVLGSTDSEHAAALYMTNLTSAGAQSTWQVEYSLDDMRTAMVKTATTIMQLQRDAMGAEMRPSSLNFCATDGKKLVSMRFRNHSTEQPPSLYYSETAGRTLNHKYPGDPNSLDGALAVNTLATKVAEDHGKHVVVASEPTTFDSREWHLIPRNNVLLVDRFGNKTEATIEYDLIFNAKDPDAVA